MSKKSISKIFAKAARRINIIQTKKRKQLIKARIKQIKSQKITKGRNIFIEKINIKENVFIKKK